MDMGVLEGVDVEPVNLIKQPHSKRYETPKDRPARNLNGRLLVQWLFAKPQDVHLQAHPIEAS